MLRVMMKVNNHTLTGNMKPALYLTALSVAIGAVACVKLEKISWSVASKHYPVLVKPKANLVNWQEKLVQGIMKFESFKAHPYRCPAGVLTVGYGHTGKYANQSMTQYRAEQILRSEIEESRLIVIRTVKVKLSEQQLAALTSFTFNCGESNLRTLVNGRSRLNSGNYKSVEKIMPLYVKADGKNLRGLKHRRSWELELWKGIFSI